MNSVSMKYVTKSVIMGDVSTKTNAFATKDSSENHAT